MPQKHTWLAYLVTFFSAVIVNGLLLAYSYGKQEARMQALERHEEIRRAEWKEGRARIESAINKLEEAIEKLK